MGLFVVHQGLGVYAGLFQRSSGVGFRSNGLAC